MRTLIALLLLLGGGIASAATIHVDARNRTGVEDGSAAAPFDAIQEAIEAAVRGDVVSVAPGVYYGAILLKDGVKVISQRGREVTVIDGMGAYAAVTADPTSQSLNYIQGFTIRNADNLAVSMPNWWNYLQIRDSALHDATSTGVSTRSSCFLGITRTLIRNVPVAVSSQRNYEFGAYLNGVTIDSVGTALRLFRADAVLNNTTVTNAGYVVALIGAAAPPRVWGAHNNIHDYAVLNAPDFYGQRADLSGLEQPMDVDPLFVNRAAGDYRLTAASPLVDAGYNGGYYESLPYEGAAPDIGAYEYAPSLPDRLDALAESFAAVPAPAFRNVADQRGAAIQRKLAAIVVELGTVTDDMPAADQVVVLSAIRSKLENDLLAKCDGFFGGNPANDWITDREAQEQLVPELRELLAAVQARIDALAAP